MLKKALKFRLYPTPAQETVLCETLETCRGVYNSLLNERKHDYEVHGTSRDDMRVVRSSNTRSAS